MAPSKKNKMKPGNMGNSAHIDIDYTKGLKYSPVTNTLRTSTANLAASPDTEKKKKKYERNKIKIHVSEAL